MGVRNPTIEASTAALQFAAVEIGGGSPSWVSKPGTLIEGARSLGDILMLARCPLLFLLFCTYNAA